MAKFQVGQGIDEYISQLQNLEFNSEDIIGRAIYKGADIVADAIKAKADAINSYNDAAPLKLILESNVLPDTVRAYAEPIAAALAQIREKNYAAELLARGIPAERIYAYGIAFQGKSVLVAGGMAEI